MSFQWLSMRLCRRVGLVVFSAGHPGRSPKEGVGKMGLGGLLASKRRDFVKSAFQVSLKKSFKPTTGKWKKQIFFDISRTSRGKHVPAHMSCK